MFCSGCGKKIEGGDKFCQSCGQKVDIVKTTMKPSQSQKTIATDVFYSEDWQRTGVITFASFSYFDVMADKENLYLIALPKYYGATIGFLIGIFFKLVGALIGYYIGARIDKGKRQKYRKTWLNSNQEIVSRNYEKDIFLKFPLSGIKNNIVLKKNKFVLTNDAKKITLRKNRKEGERFNNFIRNYVL